MYVWVEVVEYIAHHCFSKIVYTFIVVMSPQSERSVYHGRTGIKLPFYHGRFRVHYPGSIQCTKYSKAEQIFAAFYWICLCSAQFLHGESLHEDEVAVSFQLHASS